jgi:hypothetical protein
VPLLAQAVDSASAAVSATAALGASWKSSMPLVFNISNLLPVVFDIANSEREATEPVLILVDAGELILLLWCRLLVLSRVFRFFSLQSHACCYLMREFIFLMTLKPSRFASLGVQHLHRIGLISQ